MNCFLVWRKTRFLMSGPALHMSAKIAPVVPYSVERKIKHYRCPSLFSCFVCSCQQGSLSPLFPRTDQWSAVIIKLQINSINDVKNVRNRLAIHKKRNFVKHKRRREALLSNIDACLPRRGRLIYYLLVWVTADHWLSKSTGKKEKWFID